MIAGGWIHQNWVQLGYQLIDTVAGGTYSFVGTCVILGCLDGLGKFLPIFKLRVSEEEEIMGIDDVEIGEFAYDYVELAREVGTIEDADATSEEQSIDVMEEHGHGHGHEKHPSYGSDGRLT